MDRRKALQQMLYHEIPISEAMGVCVDHYDGNTLQLSAPKEQNSNHKNTAFGGSLSTLAITTAWSLLQLKLAESGLQAEVVIQQANTDFLHPVTARLVCQCHWDDKKWPRFINGLERHGRARMALEATVTEGGQQALHFVGRYVAIRQEP